MMTCVNAEVDYASILFVFKGKWMPFERLFERQKMKWKHYYLVYREGLCCIYAKRLEVSTVNASLNGRNNLLKKHGIKPLGRKVFLTFDGYWSHMGIRVLNYLQNNDVVSYALPEDTSGKTHPCDVQLFGVFKKTPNEIISGASDPYSIDHFDVYDF